MKLVAMIYVTVAPATPNASQKSVASPGLKLWSNTGGGFWPDPQIGIIVIRREKSILGIGYKTSCATAQVGPVSTSSATDLGRLPADFTGPAHEDQWQTPIHVLGSLARA